MTKVNKRQSFIISVSSGARVRSARQCRETTEGNQPAARSREVPIKAVTRAPADKETAGLTELPCTFRCSRSRNRHWEAHGKPLHGIFGRQRTGPPECRCGGKCSPNFRVQEHRSILLPLRNRLNRLAGLTYCLRCEIVQTSIS